MNFMHSSILTRNNVRVPVHAAILSSLLPRPVGFAQSSLIFPFNCIWNWIGLPKKEHFYSSCVWSFNSRLFLCQVTVLTFIWNLIQNLFDVCTVCVSARTNVCTLYCTKIENESLNKSRMWLIDNDTISFHWLNFKLNWTNYWMTLNWNIFMSYCCTFEQ